MKTSRTVNAALALLVLTGAGFWVKHNLRRETAPVLVPPAASASSEVSASAPTRPSAPVPASAPTLGAVLTSSTDPQATTANLSHIVLDPTRSASDRDEALGHLLNLSANDPSATLLPLLADARLSDAQCSQILDDSLNSALTWQADAHLAVLSHRKSPEAVTRAREHLVFLLGVDHGTDLAKWTHTITATKKTWAAMF